MEITIKFKLLLQTSAFVDSGIVIEKPLGFEPVISDSDDFIPGKSNLKSKL